MTRPRLEAAHRCAPPPLGMTAPTPYGNPSGQLLVQAERRKRFAEQVSEVPVQASGNPPTARDEPPPKKARGDAEERVRSKATEICSALPTSYAAATSSEERMLHASAVVQVGRRRTH